LAGAPRTVLVLTVPFASTTNAAMRWPGNSGSTLGSIAYGSPSAARREEHLTERCVEQFKGRGQHCVDRQLDEFTRARVLFENAQR
jgi:hypothetical protein